MKKENITLFGIAVLIIAIVVLLVLSYFKTKATPTSEVDPVPSPQIDPTKKYIDLMTSKCYNEEEIEVACKG